MTGPFHPKIVVDTDVFSFIFNGHSRAIDYLPYVDSRQCYLTFVTIGELYHGAYKANWGSRRRAELQKAIENYSIINVGHRVAKSWGYIMASCERNARSIGIKDAWVAACAWTYGWPLLTNNVRHFEAVPSLMMIGPNIRQ